MNKKCYIVGAGDNSGTNFTKGINEYVIAADGGLETLNQLAIVPDLIVGDFDSLGYVPKGNNVIRYKVEKDDTDMMLAVKKAMEMGFCTIEIFGGTGGRVDHTIANIQTMLYASQKGVAITMTAKAQTYYVITNERITLESRPSGNLSVFAIGGDAWNVNVKGAKYVAAGLNLTPDNPTAVSNSYIGSDVTISVERGSVLIISDR
ncbi:MAG: thiamine diphosphokinase [Eubacterium sp.]